MMFRAVAVALAAVSAASTATARAITARGEDRFYRLIVQYVNGRQTPINPVFVRPDSEGKFWAQWRDTSAPPPFEFLFKGQDDGNPTRWIFNAAKDRCLSVTWNDNLDGWAWHNLSDDCTNFYLEELPDTTFVLGADFSSKTVPNRGVKWNNIRIDFPSGRGALGPCNSGTCFGDMVYLQVSQAPSSG